MCLYVARAVVVCEPGCTETPIAIVVTDARTSILTQVGATHAQICLTVNTLLREKERIHKVIPNSLMCSQYYTYVRICCILYTHILCIFNALWPHGPTFLQFCWLQYHFLNISTCSESIMNISKKNHITVIPMICFQGKY